MTSHLDDQVLSDLLDDAVDAPTRMQVDAHLATCDACFARVQRMRVLVQHASSLPADMPPPPDEWQRVRARLGRETVIPITQRWTRRSGLLAAGLALVILSSAVTALLLRGREDIAVQDSPVPATATFPRLASLEHEYATVTRDLERELAARKHTLAPETIAAVERSLRTIDAAIAEAREALVRDPASETLARLLVAGHDQKVELLRHAARLATQT